MPRPHPTLLNFLGRHWSESPTTLLDREVARRRASGESFVDLTGGGAVELGLGIAPDAMRAIVESALGVPTVLRAYRPDPRGSAAAREAIAGYYARRGEPADPARIVMTPGTSLAYLYALRLLTEPGDEILVPHPGYPLFDDLAAVCDVRLRRYHLSETKAGWGLDPEEVLFQITPRTRLLMLVSPHNPTGMVIGDGVLARLAEICTENRLPVVFDEVFRESAAPAPFPTPARHPFPLVLTLNGFSKMFTLPGWKVAWIKADGDVAHVEPFIRAAEHLSDTFLPVGELQQATVSGIFRVGDPGVLAAASAWIASARRNALDRLPGAPIPAAGVYLCSRLPPGADEEAFALRLLGEDGVLVHPGFYYDLPGWAVFTCLAEAGALEAAIQSLANCTKRVATGKGTAPA